MELITDSAGAGRVRGGLGVRADYRILTDGVSAPAALNRCVVAPRGRAGGGPGATSHTVVIARDGSVQVHGFETFPVARGQVVSHRTGGGGGWGHAIRRDPARVAADVRAGLLSPEAATRNHGPAWQTAPVPGDGHVRAEVDSAPDDPLTRLVTALTEGELSAVDALDARLARLEQAKPAMAGALPCGISTSDTTLARLTRPTLRRTRSAVSRLVGAALSPTFTKRPEAPVPRGIVQRHGLRIPVACGLRSLWRRGIAPRSRRLSVAGSVAEARGSPACGRSARRSTPGHPLAIGVPRSQVGTPARIHVPRVRAYYGRASRGRPLRPRVPSDGPGLTRAPG
jgi:hypothetical protein